MQTDWIRTGNKLKADQKADGKQTGNRWKADGKQTGKQGEGPKAFSIL